MTGKTTYETSSGGGIGFLGALGILFIALKLTGVIGWSWWWVLSPLWIPWALFAFGALLGLSVYLTAKALTTRRRAKRQAAIRDGRRLR
jgi:hypothetical protein